MKLIHHSQILTCLFLMSPVLTVGAADRVRPGQWSGSTTVGGKTFPTSNCITQSDANALNGDAKSVQSYLEKIIPPEVCKIAGVKVDGSKVVYSATCAGQPAKVMTTIYQGTSLEGTDSSGGKSEGKLIGGCK